MRTAATATLLTTKLHRPHVTRDMVARPRLWDLLDRGLDGQIIIVAAGAGYGKTTLVSSWLKSRANGYGDSGASITGLPAAWLSLDEFDSDLNIFVRYVVAALRTIWPDACPDTLALLQAPQQPPLAALIATLSNEIDILPNDFVLVLDDFHSVSGEQVPDLLAGLSRHWPRPLHLVLITRHNPPLPTAILRAKGVLSEIRMRELRFTSDETADYMRRVMVLPPGRPVLEKLEQQTEGWITGLHLAALRLSQGAEVAALTGPAPTDAFIAEYLIEEVLASQPPDILTFLENTSLLDRFCTALCDLIAGVSPAGRNARACLDSLESQNLFVIPLDDHQEWYRYHHLLQDVLRRRALTALGSERMLELHRQAAAWFDERGFVEEAIRHSLAAHDLDFAAHLMEQGLSQVLNREDRPTLDRWLSLLPRDLAERRPGLLMLKAWALALAWRLSELSTTLDRVETLIDRDAEALSADDLRFLRGQAATLRAQEAYFGNQAARSIACAQEGLPLLPESWTYVRGGCMLYLGLSMQALGQGSAAGRLLHAQYEALHEKSDSFAVRILFALCVDAVQAGQLEQARQVGELMLQQSRRGELVLLQAWAHYWLGLVHYQWNDLETAAQHFGAIVDQRYAVQSLAARQGLIGLILAQVARGEIAGAGETMSLLSEYDVELLGDETEETLATRARLQFLQGDTARALRWADAFTAPIPDRPLLWPQDPHVARAGLLLARGAEADVQSALQIIDALAHIAERTHNTRFTILLLAMRALALDAQGQDRAAQISLQQAIDLAQPGGFIRVFVDLGPPMYSLLSHLALRRTAADTIRRILDAFPTREPLEEQPSVPQPTSRLIEPLTDRELDVLMLLRERLSNKEIAQRLCLSANTVKRHAVNIYGKLGVGSRREAVAVAETLGILPPR